MEENKNVIAYLHNMFLMQSIACINEKCYLCIDIRFFYKKF